MFPFDNVCYVTSVIVPAGDVKNKIRIDPTGNDPYAVDMGAGTDWHVGTVGVENTNNIEYHPACP